MRADLFPLVTTLALTDRILVITNPATDPALRQILVSDFFVVAGLSNLLNFVASAAGVANPLISATIQNDLGTTISFLRTGVGTFTLQILEDGEAQEVFTEDKTTLPNAIAHTFTEGDGSVSTRFLTFTRTDAATITIKNKYQAGDEVDGFAPLTINISVVK
jgi:hypothetical protein